MLFGGLAQQEPSDPNGVMSRLRKLANSDERVCYPGQYHSDQVSEPPWVQVFISFGKILAADPGNVHTELESPRAVDRDPDLAAAPRGERFLCHSWNRRCVASRKKILGGINKQLTHHCVRAGCITGTGAYLKSMKPSVKTIG